MRIKCLSTRNHLTSNLYPIPNGFCDVIKPTAMLLLCIGMGEFIEVFVWSSGKARRMLFQVDGSNSAEVANRCNKCQYMEIVWVFFSICSFSVQPKPCISFFCITCIGWVGLGPIAIRDKPRCILLITFKSNSDREDIVLFEVSGYIMEEILGRKTYQVVFT